MYFELFELLSVIVFSIEYLLRLWTCTLFEKYASPVLGRARFIISPFAIIDLLAIAPSLILLLFPGVPMLEMRHLRSLRIIRLIRLLKLGRYSQSVSTLGTVVRSKKEELIITLVTVSILLLLSSSFIYLLENDKNENFSSIPAAMWWGVATLTTVGYGDVYPVTPLGRFFAAIVAILGVGVFALPAGILASGFADELARQRLAEQALCPHCGKDIHER